MATKAIARRRRSTFVRKVGRRAKHMTIPLSIVGGFTPMGVDLLNAYRIGGAQTALEHVSMCTTGYNPADGKFLPGFAMAKLYGPLLLGTLVHKAANRLGINRMIANAGIPLVRI